MSLTMPDKVSLPPVKTSYSSALLNLADRIIGQTANTLTSLSYGPILLACRMAVISMMSDTITHGSLRLITADQTYVFPALPHGSKAVIEPVPEVRVIRDTFWLRLVLLGDMGFAEAYMAGDCDVSDLVQVFKTFIRSQTTSAIPDMSTLSSRLFSLITSFTNSRFANTLSNSICNISAHYDLSNGMFAAFLSKDMMYSCAIFGDLDGDVYCRPQINGEVKVGKLLQGGDIDELEIAQTRKIRHIIKKADIKAGHRVLEIGSGWGSFAIEAVRSTGCTVDTITLSLQQKVLAEERIKAAGLEDSISVWLMDYRALPESWKAQFDRVVSIEMVEAVGKEFIGDYFGVIDMALNNAGVACIQSITLPESRFENYQRDVDFIQKYIFPGGFLPTVTCLVEEATKGSENRLVVDSIGNIGPHYARTLREWRIRFLARFKDTIEPSLRAEHPEMTDESVEVFKRKWIYYFCYCEAGFVERVIGVHILTFVREGYTGYGCQVYE